MKNNRGNATEKRVHIKTSLFLITVIDCYSACVYLLSYFRFSDEAQGFCWRAVETR
jgi:hypothetical protein